MISKTRALAATVVLSCLIPLGGGCSGATGQPPAGSTVELQADYPSYDTDGLFGAATLIVVGTAIGSESTVVTPRYEVGDSPEDDPWFGLSDEEREHALAELQDAGIAATAVTFRVDAAYRGEVGPGQEITIMQTGGVLDGVDYQVSGETELAVGSSYLLFAKDSFDGAFAILGGSVGTYISSSDGGFAATATDSAAAGSFTASEVESLAG
ncbi:MAG: hypothetical protein LBG11_08965 [Bifidobacteriaceae bacterium]|jgi:hypothetical protein|nr:hypothetical protein [Bifidobacteriaceae bacterium]